MGFTVVFHHHQQQLFPRVPVLFLLLLLRVHPSQPGPVHGSPDAGHEARQHNGLSDLVRVHSVEGLLHGNTGERHKRQVFDFSENTPAPKRNTSDSNGASEPVGGDLSDLFGPSNDSDSGVDAGSSDSTCLGIDVCGFGYQCDNGGTCFFNKTSCMMGCRCPPPYDDPELYDQTLCRALDSAVSSTTTTTATATSSSAVSPGGTTCWSLNKCDFGYQCHNGGTCYYNTTTCEAYCLCPPPYDNPGLYDQQLCTPLSTTPYPPSSSVPTPIDTTLTGPHPPPPPSTTLRPLPERQCRDFTCLHGYCNATDFSRPPCRCDPGWQGFFCDFGCFRNCSNGGRCKHYSDTGKQKCLCLKPWTGENCTELEPDPSTSKQDKALVYWLSGSFTVAIVVVVTCGALFMFYLWRKRFVFALKVVYYFLSYEDNDGRHYDAFVSYVLADADETFVHTLLRPKLENEMGFNLCLHQRDYPVGGVISDTILNALENSRRFILILTPSYLRNEWAEFEFQRAFHEMLKRKIRIIPILVEDITECLEDTLNPTLKNILDSVALLRFPGTTAEERKFHKFWKQLKLCMPKRKKKDDVAIAEVAAENGTAGVRPADDANTNDNHIVGNYERNGDRIYAETNAVELCSNVCDDGRENKGTVVDQHGRCEDAVELSNINVRTDSGNKQDVYSCNMTLSWTTS